MEILFLIIPLIVLPARSFSMPVRTILMRAMQVMVDLVMDLLDRIAMEVASILELEGKETLTIAEINTGARLVLRDSKDGEHACRPFLEMNLVHYYASLKYTQYMACIDSPGPPPLRDGSDASARAGRNVGRATIPGPHPWA